jgi:hypothetical protein
MEEVYFIFNFRIIWSRWRLPCERYSSLEYCWGDEVEVRVIIFLVCLFGSCSSLSRGVGLCNLIYRIGHIVLWYHLVVTSYASYGIDRIFTKLLRNTCLDSFSKLWFLVSLAWIYIFLSIFLIFYHWSFPIPIF